MPRARRAVVVRAPRGVPREAFLDAAYRMIDRAWVRIDERSGRLAAVLTPRGASAGLAEEFASACLAARALRRGAGAARLLKAAVMSRALVRLQRVDSPREDPTPLPPERLAEIARLIAEDAAAPRDPLGLRVPWEELRRGGERKR